jgi:hypothetical protein
MQSFEASQLIDLVIVATLLEWAALAWLWRSRRRGLPLAALARMFLPGLCLMLAMRSVVVGAPWYGMAVLLSAAGLAHAADLKSRWNSRPGDPNGE